jgi:hypothetical protein
MLANAIGGSVRIKKQAIKEGFANKAKLHK